MLSTKALQESATATIGVLLLYFIPTILMVFAYILIYHQCETLMVMSKIQLSENIHPNMNKRTEQYFKLTYNIVLATFTLFQIGFVVLSLFSIINLRGFFIELTTFSSVVIVSCNFYLCFTYCKNTGSPYKNRKYYEAVRYIGLVGGYWTCAFLFKLFMMIFGQSLF